MTYTIYAPSAWSGDIEPAMESHALEIEDGRQTDPAVIKVVEQYWDRSRVVKRGKGRSIKFELDTEAEVRFLRGEAHYRWDFNGGGGNKWGADEPDVRARSASKVLMDRCDQVLQQIKDNEVA